jgi:hypothetical protein
MRDRDSPRSRRYGCCRALLAAILWRRSALLVSLRIADIIAMTDHEAGLLQFGGRYALPLKRVLCSVAALEESLYRENRAGNGRSKHNADNDAVLCHDSRR